MTGESFPRKRPSDSPAPAAKRVAREPSALHCPVCRDLFDEEQRKPKSLPCGHCLCGGCCRQTLEGRCPVCRHKSTKNALKNAPSNFALLQTITADGPLFECSSCFGATFARHGWLAAGLLHCSTCRLAKDEEGPGLSWRNLRKAVDEEVAKRLELWTRRGELLKKASNTEWKLPKQLPEELSLHGSLLSINMSKIELNTFRQRPKLKDALKLQVGRQSVAASLAAGKAWSEELILPGVGSVSDGYEEIQDAMEKVYETGEAYAVAYRAAKRLMEKKLEESSMD